MNRKLPPTGLPAAAPEGSHDVSAGMTAALATLRDVAGIAGSFVFTSTGELFARDIHPMFDDITLSDAAERLTRLQDTFASVGDHLEMAVIRYQDHKLYLKALTGGMLCILADGVVNLAALRMAANLVGRRIAPELVRASSPPPLPPAPDAFMSMPARAADAHAAGTGVAGGSAAPTTTIPYAPERPPSPLWPAAPPSAASGTRRFRGRTVD